MKRLSIALAAVLLGGGVALAAELTYDLPGETAEFKPGNGVEAAQNNCSACHSADYIATQPSGKGKDFWTAEVKKMKKVYGAPIDDGDIDAIASYLAANY